MGTKQKFLARLEYFVCHFPPLIHTVVAQPRTAIKDFPVQKTRRLAPLPPLASAVGATTWVLGLPVLAFVLFAAVAEPSPFAAGAVTISASSGAAFTATRWWRARTKSSTVTLSDLMLWSWWRRIHAYHALEQGEDLLVESGEAAEVDFALLESLAGALEILDPYTHGHSRRVEHLAKRTALALDEPLSEEEIDLLGRAAVLHDIGKMHVPEDLLSKLGPLTPDERASMQEHVSVGAQLVAKVGESSITQAVLHHHEAWDGTGYPGRLSGEAIPLFARIIAVADAYDAMVSARPYRASLGRTTAIRTLESEAGRQFDPQIVEAFLSVLREPAGLAVLLPAFGIAQRLGRDAFAWARRTGASTLAPTAGSCAAAAAVSTALLVSPTGVHDWNDRGRVDADKAITRRAEVDNSTAVITRKSGERIRVARLAGDRKEATDVRIREFSIDAPAVEPPGFGGPKDEPPQSEGPDGTDPGGDTVGPPVDPGDDGTEPENPDDGGIGGPNDGGSDPVDPGTGGGPAPDPQPDKGKDCEVPPESPGKEIHCDP